MGKYSTQISLLNLILLSTLLQSSLKATPQTPIPNLKPQFPCNPPQNSYPFCNTTLSIALRSHQLLSLLTLPEKIRFLCNNFSGIPRLGIPPYQWWSESLHGIATNGPGINFNGSIKSATLFPQVLNAAATFNRSLWFETATAIGVEGRAMYNAGQSGLTFWAPNVNIFRDPRWGRGQETPGEDPLVASAYAEKFVKGFQGEYGEGYPGKNMEEKILEEENGGMLTLSACCKHYTAYDLEKWGNFSRYSFNAVVTKQDMEDTYEPPFKNCVQQGKASCLMCSYNSINGVPGCANRDLLQKARSDWGFKGYIASDCDAVATIYEYQFYVKTPEDAVAEALKAGVDINCGTYMLYNTESAIKQGKLKEKDIDRALKNLFLVLLRMGLFNGDPLKGKFGRLGRQDVCTKEHQRLALDAARQGIVLLKNAVNFLPLNKKHVSSLAIIGPGANSTSYHDLGGTYSGFPCNARSYVDGLRTYIKKTTYVSGCMDVACESNSTFDEALLVAEVSDYIILVVGLDLTQETEDEDRVTLLLPGKQMDLVSLVASISKRPIILVLTGGGPLDVSFAEGDSRIASIIWIGYPGEAGSKALAEVIFGDYNPGGRLPMTWYPESFTKIPMNNMNMRADPTHLYPGRTHRFYTGEVVYEFGHGLSYTNYTYKLLSAPSKRTLVPKASASLRKLYESKVGIVYVPVDDLLSCDTLRFNVQLSVMNIGHMDGSHVVLLYSKASSNVEGAPRQQLVGFSRVHTTAHGTTDTSFEVDPCEHFSFANEHGQRILTLGEHILKFGKLEHSMMITM